MPAVLETDGVPWKMHHWAEVSDMLSTFFFGGTTKPLVFSFSANVPNRSPFAVFGFFFLFFLFSVLLFFLFFFLFLFGHFLVAWKILEVDPN